MKLPAVAFLKPALQCKGTKGNRRKCLTVIGEENDNIIDKAAFSHNADIIALLAGESTGSPPLTSMI